MIKIPMNGVSREALRGMVEAFVLREGTDYGPVEYTLDQKCAQVARQLEAGLAELWFDPASGSVEVQPRPAGRQPVGDDFRRSDD